MAARAATPCAADPNEIELPLAAVVASLPLDLRAKLMAAPPAGQTIHLPVETVISQLAFGAVKISFGELRQLAPGTFVNSGGGLDNKLVNLPLQEILPRLNPALLARHAPKKVEVAEDITGPFTERGRGLTFTVQTLKAPAAPAPAPGAEAGPEPEPPTALVPPLAARHISAAPLASQIPPRSFNPPTPTHGASGNGHGRPLSAAPLPPRSGPPAPSNGVGNNGHGNGHGPPPTPGLRLGPLNGNSRADAPAPLRMQVAPTPAPSPTPAPVQPAQAPPTIFATLGDLCDDWPEGLKNEILRSPLAQTNVPLEGSVVLPGLKRGRVVLPWKQLRLLAQPSSAPSPHDAVELELPLKVIAPLFLAAQKNPAPPRAKAAVSADIPDLFFGFPQAAPPPPPAPASVAPVAHPEPGVQDSNYYVWGEKGEIPQADEAGLRRGEAPQTDFMSRLAHPKEVVARAAALAGVAGSVVAMQDGLRVASQVPAELNADTLAAFLPQIFERVNQCTRELRMGALNNVNFTVGNVPWKIFRVNAVYFAAFGRAGEQLPSAQLAQLAAELDRKKQR